MIFDWCVAQNYVASFVRAALVNDLNKASIPNQSDEDNTPVGKITVDLSNFKVSSASISGVTVTPTSANSFDVKVAGLNLALVRVGGGGGGGSGG